MQPDVIRLRAYLTFTRENVTKPIIWELIKTFDVVVNIRTAEVKDGMGLMALEIDGKPETVEKAVAWLESKGVRVEPIEQSVVAG